MGLEYVELVMRLEEDFGLEIPDGDAEHLTTIGEIEDYLMERMAILPDDREALFERIQAIVVDELGLPPHQVRRESRVVGDLYPT